MVSQQHIGSVCQRMPDDDPASLVSISRSPAPQLLAHPLQLPPKHSSAAQPDEVRLPLGVALSNDINKGFHFNQRYNQPVLLLHHLVLVHLLFDLSLHQPYTIPFDKLEKLKFVQFFIKGFFLLGGLSFVVEFEQRMIEKSGLGLREGLGHALPILFGPFHHFEVVGVVFGDDVLVELFVGHVHLGFEVGEGLQA